MGDDDVKPRLDGEPPSSNPQHSDASFLDAEYEEEPLPCLTDNDYDDDVDRPPLQATRPEPFRPSQDLAHNPRDVLRADYDHENRHYSKLHNLVMAFNPLRPLWPTGLPPAGEIAPPATFADRAPTAAELAALDMGPAVVAMAARADMMNILTEELKKVARLMLRFIKDALVEAGDGSTSDRPVVPTPPPHGRTAPAPPPIGIGSWLEDCSPKPAPFDTNRPSVLHPTSQGAAQRTQESPTWQLRCRTFPARTASSWCYFETSSSAPPEPLFPIQNTSRPLPRPTAGRAPPPVITHDMPRGTARNFVYGPPLYTETPEQFRGRLQVDLVTSEAAARLILARQAVEENDKQRQADRTSERAALGLGRPPSGLCNPKKDAAASNRFACTIDGAPTAGPSHPRMSAAQHQRQPAATRAGPREISRPLPGGTHELFGPAPGYNGFGGIRPIQSPPGVPPTRPLAAEPVPSRIQRSPVRPVCGRASLSPTECKPVIRHSPRTTFGPVMDMNRASGTQQTPRRFWDDRHPMDRPPIQTDTPPPPITKHLTMIDEGRKPLTTRIWSVAPPLGPPVASSTRMKRRASPSPDGEPPTKRLSTLLPRPGPSRPTAQVQAYSGWGSSAASGPSSHGPARGTNPRRSQAEQPLPPRQHVPSADHLEDVKLRITTEEKDVKVEDGESAAGAPTVRARRGRSRPASPPPAPSTGMAPSAWCGTASTTREVGRSGDVSQTPAPLPSNIPAVQAGPSTRPSTLSGTRATTPLPALPGPPDHADADRRRTRASATSLPDTAESSQTAAQGETATPSGTAAIESPVKRRSSTRIQERNAKRQRTESRAEPGQPEAGPSRPSRSSFVGKIIGAAAKKLGKKDEKKKKDGKKKHK